MKFGIQQNVVQGMSFVAPTQAKACWLIFSFHGCAFLSPGEEHLDGTVIFPSLAGVCNLRRSRESEEEGRPFYERARPACLPAILSALFERTCFNNRKERREKKEEKRRVTTSHCWTQKERYEVGGGRERVGREEKIWQLEEEKEGEKLASPGLACLADYTTFLPSSSSASLRVFSPTSQMLCRRESPSSSPLPLLQVWHWASLFFSSLPSLLSSPTILSSPCGPADLKKGLSSFSLHLLGWTEKIRSSFSLLAVASLLFSPFGFYN